MFDRLMRRTILSQTNRIVREHIGHGLMHHGRQPHGGAEVIAEDKKRRHIGSQAGQRHAIGRRGHAMFANPKVKIASRGRRGRKVSSGFNDGLGGWRQIGRASDEPGHASGDGVDHLTGRNAGRRVDIGIKTGNVLVPVSGQTSCKERRQLGRSLPDERLGTWPSRVPIACVDSGRARPVLLQND